jgi:hypothetical protein
LTPNKRTSARKKPTRKKPARQKTTKPSGDRVGNTVAATPVTAAELDALKRELQRRMQPAKRGKPSGAHSGGRDEKGAPLRWNPDAEDVQKSVAQLVLTIVEFLRQLMERQAIRRMEAKTLTPAEVEAVGLGLMRLEETVREIGGKFGLAPEDLNLDLGPIKLI